MEGIDREDKLVSFRFFLSLPVWSIRDVYFFFSHGLCTRVIQFPVLSFVLGDRKF